MKLSTKLKSAYTLAEFLISISLLALVLRFGWSSLVNTYNAVQGVSANGIDFDGKGYTHIPGPQRISARNDVCVLILKTDNLKDSEVLDKLGQLRGPLYLRIDNIPRQLNKNNLPKLREAVIERLDDRTKASLLNTTRQTPNAQVIPVEVDVNDGRWQLRHDRRIAERVAKKTQIG